MSPKDMPAEKPFLFVSYARSDFDRVRPVVDAIRKRLQSSALPADLWMDVSHLKPGEQWDIAITDALQGSIGFLFFLSSHSITSDWVRREVEVAARSTDRLIIPVLLDRTLDLPPTLATRQWVDLSNRQTSEDINNAATQIADAVASYLKTTRRPKSGVSATEAPFIAAEIANRVRASGEPAPEQGTQNAVFVVHGHNADALAKLETFLSVVGVVPIVLSRQDTSPQSLFQKFMSVATQAKFAIVLFCADDYGAARRQYDVKSVADRALQFRARQNVILELGFF